MRKGSPINPVIDFLKSFTPSGVGRMARRNFKWEMNSALLLPIAVTCVEGEVVSVLIKKGFIPPVAQAQGVPESVYDQLVALVAAAGPLAMLTSVLWSRLFHGRDRVRMINALQVMVLVCVGLIALMPVTEAGLFGLVGLMVAARCCLTGIVTARTDVWRANYPPLSRARISGRITMVTSLVMAITVMALGRVIDRGGGDVGAFRLVYAFAVLGGLGGVMAYGRIRWRGRGRHIEQELDEGERRLDRPGPRAMMGVLKNDAVYRRFMFAQFVLGLPNIAAAPIFIIALEETFRGISYTASLTLVRVVPILLPLLSIPVWSLLLDRMHIVRYRTYHSWFFVLANALMGVGLLTEELWVLFLARVTLGIAFGGGMLAWQLGHHDFARRELASIYMGVHVTLTGVRGLVAPFVGVALFSGIPVWLVGHDAGWVSVGLGAWTFLLLACVGLVGTMLFLRLNLQLRAAGNTYLAPTREG